MGIRTRGEKWWNYTSNARGVGKTFVSVVPGEPIESLERLIQGLNWLSHMPKDYQFHFTNWIFCTLTIAYFPFARHFSEKEMPFFSSCRFVLAIFNVYLVVLYLPYVFSTLQKSCVSLYQIQ